jgi:hypothetical protein
MAKRGQMARKPPTTHKRATARKRSVAPLDLGGGQRKGT